VSVPPQAGASTDDVDASFAAMAHSHSVSASFADSMMDHTLDSSFASVMDASMAFEPFNKAPKKEKLATLAGNLTRACTALAISHGSTLLCISRSKRMVEGDIAARKVIANAYSAKHLPPSTDGLSAMEAFLTAAKR
jgi:hypothetical protein